MMGCCGQSPQEWEFHVLKRVYVDIWREAIVRGPGK
jgi:hypothetical protein